MHLSRLVFFFFNDTATTEIYTLSLHDALPIFSGRTRYRPADALSLPRSGRTGYERTAKTARARTTRSEEHTSELQSRQYLVCRLLLEKKKKRITNSIIDNLTLCVQV